MEGVRIGIVGKGKGVRERELGYIDDRTGKGRKVECDVL